MNKSALKRFSGSPNAHFLKVQGSSIDYRGGVRPAQFGLKCAWSLKVYERSHPSPVYVYILKACTFSHLMSDPFIKQMMNSLRCRVEKRLSFSFSASAVITWTLTSTYRSHEIYKYTIFYFYFFTCRGFIT